VFTRVGEREGGSERGVVLQQLKLTRTHERLGTALYAELAIEIVDVALDGADGDDQLVSDRLIGVPSGDQV
jgi:hypothetical protein